jgi:hypothetical protein
LVYTNGPSIYYGVPATLAKGVVINMRGLVEPTDGKATAMMVSRLRAAA